MTHTLQSFIQSLRERGDLLEIDEYFSPDLEITEFADRQMKLPGGGKAMIFNNTGYHYPVAVNIYGSDSRISEALYCSDTKQKADEIEYLFTQLMLPKDTLAKKLKTLPLLKDISTYFPTHSSRRGICQEVVDSDINILSLPILKCWPYDGGKFITLPMVNTVNPNTGVRNVGMYRVQIFDRDLAALHWHTHKTGAAHYRLYKELHKRMPVAVALGGDPVYAYCATAPLPDGIDEYLLAGFLRKKPVKLVKCLTQPEIEVPEDVDFVIEGYVDPDEDLILEGPFGDHTGFYSLEDYYPKFHVTAITHRKDAIYPATIVGVPPMEDAWISKATEKIFTYPIRLAYVPEMQELHMPAAGVEHNITVVKIKNSYPGNVLKVKNALWGAGQMMFNKILAVYSGDREITEYEEFAREALQNFRPDQDTYIENAGVSDVLDHASHKFTIGGKICLDLTKKDGEINNAPYNYSVNSDNLTEKYESITNINATLVGKGIPCVFVMVNGKTETTIRSLAMQLVVSDKICPKILVFVDSGVPTDDIALLTWYASGNIDPATDCWIIKNNFYGVLCVDSTAKTIDNDGFTRQWPEVVMMDDYTIEKVNEKNNVKNYENLLTSPSIKLKSLRYNNGAVKYFNSKD